MHPVHFGVMLIFNLAIGLCTPPVGNALFVGCAVGKTSIEKTSVAMLPMYGAMIVALLLVTFVPFFSLWLPGLM
ncbi:MAG TPA: TRAP transporter large permease subunit, partial [Clostridiales bacterium]|nr:TRAP transporter large permease subunit [Clostridiales bacterium]